MAANTYYFPHDYNSRSNLKICALLMDYGPAGLGIYWGVVEMLHEEETHRIELKPLTYKSIAKQLCTDVETLKKVLHDCISEYDLFNEDGNFLYSERVFRNARNREETKQQKSAAGKASAKARAAAKKAEKEAQDERTAPEKENPLPEPEMSAEGPEMPQNGKPEYNSDWVQEIIGETLSESVISGRSENSLFPDKNSTPVQHPFNTRSTPVQQNPTNKIKGNKIKGNKIKDILSSGENESAKDNGSGAKAPVKKEVPVKYAKALGLFNALCSRRIETVGDKTRRQIDKLYKNGVTDEDLKTAIANGYEDSKGWAKPELYTLEYITREHKYELYRYLEKQKTKKDTRPAPVSDINSRLKEQETKNYR